MDRHELSLHHTHRDITIRAGPYRATVSARILRAYLPLAPYSLSRRTHQLDLDAYTAACPPVRHGILRASKMTRILADLADILAAASASVADPDPVAPALSDALARAMLADRSSAAVVGGAVLFSRTLAAFAALADVSRAFHARRIGAVLAAYFARHGERVVEAEAPQAVLVWAWAVGVAWMGEAERAACVRVVVGARPDVLGGGGRWEGMADRLPGMDAFWEAVGREVGGGGREYGGGGIGGRGGLGLGLEGRGRERERRRLLEDAAAAGWYMHEHRERRVVRAGGGRPLGQDTYHPARWLVDEEDLMIPWKPLGSAGLRKYGGGSGMRDALDSIKHDQRDLRRDMHDVKDGLEELVEKVDKLGRKDRERERVSGVEWRERDVVDFCNRWPEEYESEWTSEWWDDSY